MSAEAPAILVVDDDPVARAVATATLRQGGFLVVEAADAAAAEHELTQQQVGLVVLDVSMPGVNGLQLLGKLRSASQIPVIMLTSRASEIDRVLGLEIGADDYVVKPCSPRELVARVSAVLRRAAPQTARGTGADELTVDLVGRTARVGEKPVNLTRREFDLLACLYANRGRVLSQQELLERVWNSRDRAALPTVTEHIRRVRLAVEADPKEPVHIRTVRGVGYVLD